MMLLKRNNRGELVKVIQEFLGLKVDGIFGPNTEKAVKKWQSENELVADGIVGPNTWESMAAASTDLGENQEEIAPDFKIKENFLPSSEFYGGPVNKSWIFLHHTAGWENPYKVIDSWGKDRRGKIATEFILGGQNIKNNQEDFDGEIVQAFPEGGYAWHIGVGNNKLHRESVGVELCNFGYLTKGGYYKRSNGNKVWIEKNADRFYTYVGTEADDEQVVKLSNTFRGYDHWHKYSDRQIILLKKLLLFVGERDHIDIRKGLPELIKNKGAKALDIVDRNMCKETPGIWSHSNVSKWKFDIFPQTEILDMLTEL